MVARRSSKNALKARCKSSCSQIFASGSSRLSASLGTPLPDCLFNSGKPSIALDRDIKRPPVQILIGMIEESQGSFAPAQQQERQLGYVPLTAGFFS